MHRKHWWTVHHKHWWHSYIGCTPSLGTQISGKRFLEKKIQVIHNWSLEKDYIEYLKLKPLLINLVLQ